MPECGWAYSTEYKWAETVKRELQTDKFAITREQRILAEGTDWRFLNALKRELKT